MSKPTIRLKNLLRVLKEYDSFATNGQALTRTAAQRRAALRAEVCRLTGETNHQNAFKVARRLKKQSKTDPRQQLPRKKRYGGVATITPGLVAPRHFDAVRVRKVVSSAVETNRRRH
jgi:hypothetical protein